MIHTPEPWIGHEWEQCIILDINGGEHEYQMFPITGGERILVGCAISNSTLPNPSPAGIGNAKILTKAMELYTLLRLSAGLVDWTPELQNLKTRIDAVLAKIES